jgi:hypothetical protein
MLSNASAAANAAEASQRRPYADRAIRNSAQNRPPDG